MSDAREHPNALLATTDAWVWTQEFCARFSLFSEDGVIEDPHGLMLCWFANAIETGRDAGRRDAEAERNDAEAPKR